MVVVVDCELGNVGSMVNMLKKVGAQALRAQRPEELEQATKLVLPGVGAFDEGMKRLTDRGFLPVLERKVLTERVPVLGVCLGHELFAKRSDEGVRLGLGWLNAECVKFRQTAGAPDLKIPHMGWNTVRPLRASPLMSDAAVESRYYFVHSYHMVCHDPADVVGETEHGIRFPSVVARGNIFGAQFHPEKSHRFGMQVMKNFVERC